MASCSLKSAALCGMLTQAPEGTLRILEVPPQSLQESTLWGTRDRTAQRTYPMLSRDRAALTDPMLTDKVVDRSPKTAPIGPTRGFTPEMLKMLRNFI